MVTQSILSLPAGVVPLTREEEALVLGGLAPILGGALLLGGSIIVVAIAAAVVGGVVYAVIH